MANDPNKPERSDPIRERYYRPLEWAGTGSNWLFWLVGVLSIGALVVDRAKDAKAYELVQGVFIIGVLALFALGQAIRLYWTPRAEDKRRDSLLSDAFSVAITHERPTGYYNNEQTNPITRLCASLLEDSFFSKNVVLAMARWERFRMALYVIAWLMALINRSTDLAFGAVVAQAIFSEQIISHWLRLEWLRMRFEKVYDGLYQLIQTTTNFDHDTFRARVVSAYGSYETSKGYGGITLSDGVFKKLNPTLSAEWEEIRKTLHL